MKRKINKIQRSIVIFLFTVMPHLVLGAMDIWGTGEVPSITDPKDVPRTLNSLEKPVAPHGFSRSRVGREDNGFADLLERSQDRYETLL